MKPAFLQLTAHEPYRIGDIINLDAQLAPRAWRKFAKDGYVTMRVAAKYPHRVKAAMRAENRR